MDPWEVVKWVAIFRLILPDALFRLCGGRVENLGELQPLAVKAGLNGVMMGNFLTTLGVDPQTDRDSFSELGLNVARQPDNGANPRPDNRSGWLDGETPQTPVDDLIDSQAEANFWDPSTQLRVIKKKGAGARVPRARGLSGIAERLAELRRSGLHRRLRLIEGPQGPRVLLDGAEVLLLCSNNYLGLADHPRVRAAAGEAAERYGAGAGASRLISGSMELHRKLEHRLAAFKGAERRAPVRLGLPGQHRGRHRAHGPRPGRLLRRAQPRQHHRRVPALPRRDVRLPPPRHRAPGVGAAPGRRPRGARRHRRRVLDGRRRRAAGRAGRARPPPRVHARRRRGARHRRARARGAAARSPRPGSAARST